MQLTDVEKLIILMLCEIHEQLPIKDGLDAKFVKSAIETGNTWGLSWRFPGLDPNTEATPAIVREILDILEMWEIIEVSYEKLSVRDKDRLNIDFGHPTFLGFDGNSESTYISGAHFLIDQLGRFQRFRGRNLNSHTPSSVDRYRAMVEVYYSLRPILEDIVLSAQQIESILSARPNLNDIK
jgi:uncharacterized protein YfbU (UPF0304 family)